jgi:hypothetical protein
LGSAGVLENMDGGGLSGTTVVTGTFQPDIPPALYSQTSTPRQLAPARSLQS